MYGFVNISGVTPMETERNLDLENALGNLLIAEYQVHRLRERIVNMLSVYNKKGSTYSFKMNDAWFNITIGAQRDVKVQQIKEEEKKDPNPNNDRVALTGYQAAGRWLVSGADFGLPLQVVQSGQLPCGCVGVSCSGHVYFGGHI